MFFRGRQPEASISHRFRSGTESFAFREEDGYYIARVVANAERALELFLQLAAEMPREVDVALENLRAGQRWSGEGLALGDVRSALGDLAAPLARNGGVEVSVYSVDDQITLTPSLELFIYARSDRWLYILRSLALEEALAVRGKGWRDKEDSFAPAPELVPAIHSVTERLGLVAS